jgi:quinol-cytochrome oxidoreductase complex cytochrome b subunit
MKFINSLTPTKASFFPAFGLLVWGGVLAILFLLPPSFENTHIPEINSAPYILFVIYALLNLLLLGYSGFKKQGRHCIALALGFISFTVLLIPETLLFIAIGIAGGATG